MTVFLIGLESKEGVFVLSISPGDQDTSVLVRKIAHSFLESNDARSALYYDGRLCCWLSILETRRPSWDCFLLGRMGRLRLCSRRSGGSRPRDRGGDAAGPRTLARRCPAPVHARGGTLDSVASAGLRRLRRCNARVRARSTALTGGRRELDGALSRGRSRLDDSRRLAAHRL